VLRGADGEAQQQPLVLSALGLGQEIARQALAQRVQQQRAFARPARV